MSLFKMKAKVLLVSEDTMEAEETYDLGNIAKSKMWVWRDVSVPFEEVYKIISYDASKSIVQTYDGEKMLVKESSDSLNTRWAELREKYTEYSHAEWVIQETSEDEED